MPKPRVQPPRTMTDWQLLALCATVGFTGMAASTIYKSPLSSHAYSASTERGRVPVLKPGEAPTHGLEPESLPGADDGKPRVERPPQTRW